MRLNELAQYSSTHVVNGAPCCTLIGNPHVHHVCACQISATRCLFQEAKRMRASYSVGRLVLQEIWTLAVRAMVMVDGGPCWAHFVGKEQVGFCAECEINIYHSSVFSMCSVMNEVGCVSDCFSWCQYNAPTVPNLNNNIIEKASGLSE
jgi:hypothetical protein